MYRCLDCGGLFDEPEVYRDNRGEFWGASCYEEVYGCPYCSGDYEEIKDEQTTYEWYQRLYYI